MAMRCRECHAAIHAPAALDALTVTCGYCGLEQPLPDAHERRRLLLEEQREARLRAEQEAEIAAERRRDELERAKHEAERSDQRRARWWSVIKAPFVLIPMLVGPAIIAVTVFDAPGRLGCTSAGRDRLEQIAAQAAGHGCTVAAPIEAEWTEANVSRLVTIEAGACVRVIAAAGGGHSTLALRVFSSANTEVAKVTTSAEPQLLYCPPAADTLRYEIVVGPASKGRLSHAALACPAPPPPKKPKQKPRPGEHHH